MNFILLFIAVISLISVILTMYDKIAAKSGSRRIPEKTLFTLGMFGGACAMLITMLIIHHKTRHAKFMIGLPLEIVVHIGIILAVTSIL